MKQITLSILLALTLLTACTNPASTDTQIVNVYATPAAGTWLYELYDCANTASVVLNVTPDSPDILLRVGEPKGLSTPAFQIDTEELLVVVHRQSPLSHMDMEQVRALFGGQGDPSVQIWVYAEGEDIQDIFQETVMQSRNITSSARIAVNPQQMSDLLNAESNAVGILPRHWKMGSPFEIFSIGMFPVLAITPSEPQKIVKDLIACLQK